MKISDCILYGMDRKKVLLEILGEIHDKECQPIIMEGIPLLTKGHPGNKSYFNY